MEKKGAEDEVGQPSAKDLEAVAAEFRRAVNVQDRTYHLQSYPKCFVGSEAVSAAIAAGLVKDKTDALNLGNVLLDAGVFHHVTRDHRFKDEYLFYRFADDEPSKGKVAHKPDGSKVLWADFLQRDIAAAAAEAGDAESLQPKLPVDRAERKLAIDERLERAEKLEVAPLDEHNLRLLDHVHPLKWVDPDPADRYNMVVIGAGAAGLITAAGSAGVGARVALIERALMGGDCLNVGCVPSKALLKAAKIAHTVRAAGKFGVRVGGAVEVDFAAVMQRLRARRAHIARNDSAARYTKDLGVNVFIGDARFTSKYTVEVNGKTLRFIKAVIATGARAAVPPIPGIRDGQVPYLTNATVFNLTRLPPRVVVIGAGPIGLELAQAFARFGSQVTVLTRADRVLEKEDADAALVVQRALEADGVRFEMRVRFDRAELLRAAKEGDPTAIEGPAGLPLTRLHFAVGDREQRLECEALLVAVGRAANVEGLGLEAAGVEYSVRGVKVNDALQTSQKHIYAVGDAATKYQFTHMADFTARAVIRNALFFGKEKVSRMIVPWCTYTDPEVAHVGLYPADMQERGIRFTTFQKEFADNDRAVVEDATEGFVRVHVREGSDQILGATIVGPGAGDMINELTLAMHTKTGLGSLATVIHPYPTFAEAIRQCGDLYNRTRLTPTVKGLFRALMSFQR